MKKANEARVGCAHREPSQIKVEVVWERCSEIILDKLT